MITKINGKLLLTLAREAIKSEFNNSEIKIPDKDFLKDKRGVFVTLKEHGDLRGCIGFPEPILSLGEAVVRAAKSAAFDDSRFPQLDRSELNKIKIEVTVLTPPKQIEGEPRSYSKKIKIGEDGLIIRKGLLSGLLLPQVPLEFSPHWSPELFLAHTCMKAGLPASSWKEKSTKIFKFSGQIFDED